MKTWYLWGAGVLIGALAGYEYWNYIGCVSGSCAITSSPTNSTLYGGLMGLLTANVFTGSGKDSSTEN